MDKAHYISHFAKYSGLYFCIKLKDLREKSFDAAVFSFYNGLQ